MMALIKFYSKPYLHLSVCCLVLLFSQPVQAKEQINNVRIWLAPESTRLVFDLSGPVQHKIFTLKNPDRIVIDIQGASLTTELNKLDLASSPIKKLRAGNSQPLRIVFDLREPLKPSSFPLAPNNDYGHRLVVDLARISPAKVAQQRPIVKASTPSPSPCCDY